jgi:hypothetical protein
MTPCYVRWMYFAAFLTSNLSIVCIATLHSSNRVLGKLLFFRLFFAISNTIHINVIYKKDT